MRIPACPPLAAILLTFGLLLPLAPLHAIEADEAIWLNNLKPKYFGDKPIDESNAVIELTAPYRAEDPALAPIQIAAKIPQTPSRYIKTVTLLIDSNPIPFAGAFHFTPESGKADLAMRIRVNAYSWVRAIAETSDGKLSMHKVYVKASGGCSAPIGGDLDAIMKRLGKMKFRFEGQPAAGQPVQAQLLISHPNITGMQMDQISRLVQPAHFIKEVRISFNGKRVFSAETDISISADPNFRFYFVPAGPGELKAEIVDNKDMAFSASENVSF